MIDDWALAMHGTSSATSQAFTEVSIGQKVIIAADHAISDLSHCGNSVDTIDKMAHHMATAAEQQSIMDREIEQNTAAICLYLRRITTGDSTSRFT